MIMHFKFNPRSSAAFAASAGVMLFAFAAIPVQAMALPAVSAPASAIAVSGAVTTADAVEFVSDRQLRRKRLRRNQYYNRS
jgi:hypothetical protein